MDAEGLGAEEWLGSVVVVRASGAIDMLTAPQLAEAIRVALSKGPTGLVVDLTDVEFLASAGMQVLVAAHSTATPAARFAVVADGPATSRPLKIMGLADLLGVYPTLDSAIGNVAE